MLWRVNVGGDDCIHELTRRPGGDRQQDLPDFGTSERGLAYNPADDTYYAGLNDGVIQHFDASGTILDSAYVAVPVSGLAFNSSNGRLYAMTNHDLLQGFDVYVFDTRNQYAVSAASSSRPAARRSSVPWPGRHGDRLRGHLWLVDQVSQTIYEAETGEADAARSTRSRG
jgi:hypothetical protein